MEYKVSPTSAKCLFTIGEESFSRNDSITSTDTMEDKDKVVFFCEIGGFLRLSNKRWTFRSAHEYQISISEPEAKSISVGKFFGLLAPKVAATGRSDAQGRGPGIVLGEKESEVLTSHPERLLRLFTSSDKVIRSSSKRLPYEKIGLIRRGTCNDENLLLDVFPAKVVRGFLDDSSPDECDTMASVSFPCLSCVVS